MLQTQSQIEIETPRRAVPALVGWLPGGRQQFPNDPMLDRWRHQQLKQAGLITVRRRAAA